MPAQYLKDEETYTMYVQRKLVEKIEKLPVFESKNLHCSNIKLCTSVCFIHKKILSLKIFQHHFLNLFNISIQLLKTCEYFLIKSLLFFFSLIFKMAHRFVFVILLFAFISSKSIKKLLFLVNYYKLYFIK